MLRAPEHGAGVARAGGDVAGGVSQGPIAIVILGAQRTPGPSSAREREAVESGSS
jgi:hypothetical protein